MTRVKNEPKTDLELAAKKPPADELEKGRGRSGRATPKKPPRDDAQARQRARERAARDD
jgi:hypothetical protein